MTDQPTIRYANGVGLALGIYYFYTFRIHCPSNAAGLPGTIQQHIQLTGLVIGVALLISAGLPRDTAAEVIGKAAVLFCVILFASPLSVLKEAIISRSAQYTASVCGSFDHQHSLVERIGCVGAERL